ncbi:hypothetical protein FIBSPDRAFT_749654 [Athelia psychrophila]|uniref:Uncharacterized protein n=1 Tax=Athelia psychrophila TaxID=1759441 RepID=A0A166EIY5_9AGAM|nr:hypothetical protein FIBSPDRAFT_749654 [Fibularhizoctonia sp. CBS 109695]
MRLKSQTPADAQLRKALVNMRYGACTDDDITFLNTRVAGRGKDQPTLASKNFRNVPVITAYNLSKDTINALGSRRFADDNRRELVSFYSSDHYKKVETDKTTKANRRADKKGRNAQRTNSTIPVDQQEKLWDLWPSSTGHIAGKLDLCVGMPVMLRYNEATECGMTKGAEGIVVGWHSTEMRTNRPILDTVFVKLVNPAKDVQLEGLPLNVVPVTRRTEDVQVVLGNGETINITRNQVPLLLNFAMTDYTSQGRTRPYNVVDLQNCRDHMSYYVALSRSATAAGTIIVQYFDSGKIRKGISGWLRQEFRELELLDEITKLRYEMRLPVEVAGKTRVSLIKSFQAWKGTDYVPKDVHPAVAWTCADPMHKMADTEGTSWYAVERRAKGVAAALKRSVNRMELMAKTYTPALGSKQVAIPVNILKRAAEVDDNTSSGPDPKRVKTSSNIADEVDATGPVGFLWDSKNWSCAYDSLFVILCNVRECSRVTVTTALRRLNPTARVLTAGFQRISVGRSTAPTARNNIRKLLHAMKPESYPWGQTGCGIQELAEDILKDDELSTELKERCDKCDVVRVRRVSTGCKINCCKGRDTGTQACLNNIMKGVFVGNCSDCGGNVTRSNRYETLPRIIACGLDEYSIEINDDLKISGLRNALKLRGIIYYKDYHFTSRIWDANGVVWFHDGKTSGVRCERDFGPSDGAGRGTCRGAVAVQAIYGW